GPSGVDLDPDPAISAANTTKCVSVGLAVQVRTGPDLTVAPASPTMTVLQNQPFTVYALISNQGQTTATGVSVAAYLDGSRAVTYGRVDSLTVATSLNQTMTIQGVATVGAHTLELIVDPDNTINEGGSAQESNNFANITLNVQPPPAGFTAILTPTSGQSVVSGNELSVTGYVRDAGNDADPTGHGQHRGAEILVLLVPEGPGPRHRMVAVPRHPGGRRGRRDRRVTVLEGLRPRQDGRVRRVRRLHPGGRDDLPEVRRRVRAGHGEVLELPGLDPGRREAVPGVRRRVRDRRGRDGRLRGEDAPPVRRGRVETATGGLAAARARPLGPGLPGVVEETTHLRDVRRLAPRGRGDAQDGLEALPHVRDPQLDNGQRVPQVRIVDAGSTTPAERWRRRRSRPGPVGGPPTGPSRVPRRDAFEFASRTRSRPRYSGGSSRDGRHPAPGHPQSDHAPTAHPQEDRQEGGRRR